MDILPSIIRSSDLCIIAQDCIQARQLNNEIFYAKRIGPILYLTKHRLIATSVHNDVSTRLCTLKDIVVLIISRKKIQL